MDWRDHIVQDPRVLVGKPTFKGTRVSVEQVLRLLGGGWTAEQVIENLPSVTATMIQAALAYAADAVGDGPALAA